MVMHPAYGELTRKNISLQVLARIMNVLLMKKRLKK